MSGIHSEKVILIEGAADEIVPNAKLAADKGFVIAADMHGFVIMAPPGEGGERLLDMLWRITMAYAGKPSLLTSRTTVRTMVEAVWSKDSREPQPARKRELADLTRLDRVALIEAIVRPAPEPNAKLRSAVAEAESLRDPRGGRKAKTKRKN